MGYPLLNLPSGKDYTPDGEGLYLSCLWIFRKLQNIRAVPMAGTALDGKQGTRI